MNPAAEDPLSLSRLHDLVTPPPVPWWPPAPGWLIVLGLLCLMLLWGLFRSVLKWKRAASRRQALRMLRSISSEDAPLPKLDELLKRVALSAWPREEVASLTGQAWMEFLDRTGKGTAFTQGAGRVLADIAFRPGESMTAPDPVLQAAENWIRQHEGPRSC